jgi:hypothetical protein
MQNVYLLEQLAAQHRAKRRAEAKHERLVAVARSTGRQSPVLRDPARMAAAFVCWCSARLAAAVGVHMSKRRASCRECQ